MSIAELERENAELKATNAALNRENAELKAASLKLEARVNLMQTIFDSLSEGVVASNLAGEFLVANPSAQEISGMAPVEGAPEEWSETYGTFYADKMTIVPSTELPLYKAMRGETTDNVKLVLRNQNRPDGVFINVSGRPLFDKDGNLIGGVIAMRDITDLEMVTNQLETTINDLQTQNNLMDAIFNSISDGIIVANKEGKYVLFNKTAKKIVGQDIENVYTSQASEKFGLFQPENEEPYPANELPLARALRGEDVDNAEILMRNQQKPHGIDASISGRPIYDEKGIITGAVAAIRDVSERKAAESQLMAMNAQLTTQSQLMESVFNSISDGVFVVDEIGRIIMANPSARRMADMLKSVVEPDEWSEDYNFFYPDKVTPFPVDELPIMSAIRGESVDDLELFVNNDKLPEGIHLSVSGRPLEDSDGNQSGGVVVFRDVTDKIRTNEALAQAFTQGRLEIVDTVLHNIGNAINSVTVGIDTVHESLAEDVLSNRLTALADALTEHENNLGDYIENDPQGQKVLPFLRTLAHDFKAADAALRQTVERIRDRARHIVDIIRTQNSYHGTSGMLKDVKLADAISDAIQIMQDSINKRQIQVEVDCEHAPEEIRIQESQFHQMLVNLIKNSVEAIDALAGSGELDEVPRIQLRAYIDGDFLCLDITDSGIGIPPEDIKRIFSAGFTTKANGNGLGLHSSANFVISSGGKIQAFSEGKGKGTTIKIMFRYTSVYQTADKEPTQEG